MRRLKGFLLMCVGLVALTSCGGGSSPGDSVTLFKTVDVTAEATPNPYRVPLASGNSCTNGVISGSTMTADTDASVNFTSTTYPGLTGQRVTLNGYSITYTPIAGAPTIPSTLAGALSGFVGMTLAADGTATASIPLTNTAIKTTLSADPGINSCNPTEYRYYATISVSGTELGGTNSTIRAVVPIIFTNVQ